MATTSTATATENYNGLSWRYLIVRPEKGGAWDLMHYVVLGDMHRFVHTNYFNHEFKLHDHKWIIVASIIFCKIVTLFAKPMKWTGFFIEFFLNLLSQNGNFFGLLYNILRGRLVIPHRGTENFISTIGYLDYRIDLYKGQILIREGGLQPDMGNRHLMDLSMLASKIAHENLRVIKNVVNHNWNLKNANLILVSFRGTEPYDANDWSTDFDISWYEIPKVGKVHMGFLEALGLGLEPATFYFHLNNGACSSKGNFEPLCSSNGSNADQSFISEKTKMTAYYILRSKLKSLLEEHKNAKFIVTGHSMGGALAILFPSVLVLHKENELMERLLGVYTFAQPRIGDKHFGRFMEAHLQRPSPKYFRVVYCNGIVPRLPFDDKTFFYKHFGVCLYYNSFYVEKELKEEPNKNYFGIRFILSKHVNAAWELIRGLTIGYVEGAD